MALHDEMNEDRFLGILEKLIGARSAAVAVGRAGRRARHATEPRRRAV
jgi:hypothetical protein